MDRNDLLTILTSFWCLQIIISLCNDPRCLTCRENFYCQSCSPGFWGNQCVFNCPKNCDDAGCDMISGYCLKCDIGWYGPQCQQECNRCDNDLCESRKCSTGCKDGYFEDIYHNVSNCLPCGLFCKKCSNTTSCTQCNSGYYIYKFTVEAGIVAAVCSSCSIIVPNCIDCTFDQNQISCSSCEAGYAVNQDRDECVTTVLCYHCQNGCDSEGICFGGCKPVWIGQRCSYACRSECETCINQDTCLSCKDGFYTQTCTVLCNKNCQSGKYPRCGYVDGYCTNGCNKGFWGDQCEYNCNNNCLDITTASELCHRNGTCYYGCKSGYMGSDCSLVSLFSTSLVSSTLTTRASTAKQTTLLKQTKQDENTAEANVQTDFRGSLGPAIGGSIAGGYFLGVLTAAVVFYLRKRILQKQKNRKQSKNVYYNVSMSASHEERSQSDTDRHPDSNDKELASASRQSESTLYDTLSEQNKGNLYDHLEHPSESEIRQEVGKRGSHAEYYNN